MTTQENEQILEVLKAAQQAIKLSPHRDGILRRTYIDLAQDITEITKLIADSNSTDKPQGPV